MSKIGRRINLLTIIASLFAVSCTTSENDGPSGDSRVISFTPNTVSRAAVSDASGMGAFSVWGWYGKDAQITNNVFDGVTVSKSSNGWTYTGGTQYWLPGYTYNFYAVHPEYPAKGAEGQTTATVTPDGTITVTGFDCSKTGAEAVDLMTASHLSMSGDAADQVALTFSHELARLKFTVKSENTVATITSFKVYGVNYKGTLTKKETAEWSNMTPCTETATPFQLADGFTFPTENSFEKDIFGDVLLIPNTDLTGATVAIAYRYPGETEDRTSSIFLKNSTPSGWIAGKSYHYTLTIKGGSLTVTVKVVDWNEEDTSVSWG